jgi:general secretion pathway protein K
MSMRQCNDQLSIQRGSVLIVTLWTITLMTILVTVVASQNRLSAQVAYRHQQELATWAAVAAAVNQAEMEVMLEHMTRPVESDNFDVSASSLNKALADPLSRFNGDELSLYYPQAENLRVRIYEEAGKINLKSISRARLRLMIEKKLGGPRKAEQKQIDDMMEAWNDWIDLNDGATPNGAEKDYYLKLDVPYTPRNGPLETVEELLLIRGFKDVFSDVNLNAAFTVYGEDELVNLNLTTVDAMRLLPGLDDALIAEILMARRERELQGPGDVAQLVPAENMAELRTWINLNKKTNYYTILVYSQPALSSEDAVEFATATSSKNTSKQTGKQVDKEEDALALADTRNLSAYAETINWTFPTERPQILKISPYQTLPLQALNDVAEVEE